MRKRKDKEERRKGGKNQAAELQRGQAAHFARPLLRGHGHRTMPMIIGQSGHEHRADAHEARSMAASRRFFPSFHLLACERNHQDAVGRLLPHAPDSAGQRGTFNVVRVSSSVQQMPARGAGQRRDNDEGIQPRLEITTIRQIRETMAPSNPMPSPVKNLHGLAWPRVTMWLPFGKSFLRMVERAFPHRRRPPPRSGRPPLRTRLIIGCVV